MTTTSDSPAGTIPLDKWLGFLDREYLSTFIKDGGASVKFAVADDELRPNLRDSFRVLCAERGFLCIEIDAVARRVHMPQDIFFGMASQMDWRLLANRLVLRLAAESGYGADGVDPAGEGSVLDAIAAANDLDPSFLSLPMARTIQDSVFANTRMSKDFRVAMTHFCNTSRQPMTIGRASVQPLIDWLSGASARMGNVRAFAVHTPINRTTARYFIESALYWIRYVGYSGAAILLDNARVTVARNPRDGKRYYTKAMAMEHYELLREFIDGVDRLASTMLVVSANRDFVDETSARGYHIYQALQTRIMDDVRDRNIVNPIASLARLSP